MLYYSAEQQRIYDSDIITIDDWVKYHIFSNCATYIPETPNNRNMRDSIKPIPECKLPMSYRELFYDMIFVKRQYHVMYAINLYITPDMYSYYIDKVFGDNAIQLPKLGSYYDNNWYYSECFRILFKQLVSNTAIIAKHKHTPEQLERMSMISQFTDAYVYNTLMPLCANLRNDTILSNLFKHAKGNELIAPYIEYTNNNKIDASYALFDNILRYTDIDLILHNCIYPPYDKLVAMRFKAKPCNRVNKREMKQPGIERKNVQSTTAWWQIYASKLYDVDKLAHDVIAANNINMIEDILKWYYCHDIMSELSHTLAYMALPSGNYICHDMIEKCRDNHISFDHVACFNIIYSAYGVQHNIFRGLFDKQPDDKLCKLYNKLNQQINMSGHIPLYTHTFIISLIGKHYDILKAGKCI